MGTGGAISPNGLSMRFRKHLVQADLQRRIWSFSKVYGGRYCVTKSVTDL